MDNVLLSLFDSEKTAELDIYNLLLQATNSHHALSATNRKFYWNLIENYFEPILYDANPNIDSDFSTTTTQLVRFPISKNFMKSFEILKQNLIILILNELNTKITRFGLIYLITN